MRGRPEEYRLIYDEWAWQLALCGLNDERIRDFFEISHDCMAKWRKRHRSFDAAITAGREHADAQVARSLFQRATGYDNPNAEKIMLTKDGEVIRERYTEHYPPDVTACIFWLVNRQREHGQWKRNTGPEDGNGGGGVTNNVLNVTMNFPPTAEGEDRSYREAFEAAKVVVLPPKKEAA